MYAPIANLLVSHAPVTLYGARVLDVGVGTGVSAAVNEIAGVIEPHRPRVVFLAARTAPRGLSS